MVEDRKFQFTINAKMLLVASLNISICYAVQFFSAAVEHRAEQTLSAVVTN